MVQQLRRYGSAVQEALPAALHLEAERIVTEAKKLTPVRTGALRASGHVQPPEVSRGRVSVTLGFGGPAGSGNVGDTNVADVGYAVIVHENLTAYHPVGQAKYLEEPLRAAEPQLAKRIAQNVRSVIGVWLRRGA